MQTYLYVCERVHFLCIFLPPLFARFNIFNAKTLADTAYRWVKGILKQRDEMRDVQNVDIARAPRFRSEILRVDDCAQDAESFAKSVRACEREKEKARIKKVSGCE